MSSICICRYPLLIRDERGPRPVDFMSVPIEIFANMELVLPRIERTVLQDDDGNSIYYVAVHWKELDHDNVGEYDVNDHTVVAGCDPSKMSMEGSELICNVKDIYTVFHPEEEWANYHVIELHDSNRLQNSNS